MTGIRRRNNRSRRALCSLLALALSVAAPPALAYLDPGSASMLFQAAVAGVLAALFYFRQIWQRIKSFFTKAPPPELRADTPPAQAAQSVAAPDEAGRSAAERKA